MNDSKEIEYIALYYGLNKQTHQCIEEAAELIQAINKFYKDSYSGRMKIAEELADISIMADQLIYLLDCRSFVNIWRETKIERTLKKIKENEDGND